MKRTIEISVLALVMMSGMNMVYAAETAPATTDDAARSFTYNDDWALVSAPPPPGPYQSVNLDPRIPGQEDNIQPHRVSVDTPTPMADREMEQFTNAPSPAAGQPLTTPQRPVQAARQYPGSRYIQRGYGYGRAPGSGAYPPPVSQGWGGGPGRRIEPQVPPPAAYNRMMSPAPGSFGYRR